jgi:hypothetical protein
MDASGSLLPPGTAVNQVVAALAQEIRDLRRDLRDTVELIDRLRATCVTTEAKLAAAERQHAALMNHAERL